MANSKQAKKRARINEKNRKHNASKRSEMRTFIKKVRKAIELHDAKLALEEFKLACSVIDRYANKGLIHKNTASRYKSRLNKQIKNIETKAA